MFKGAYYDKGIPFSEEEVERYKSHLFNGIGIKELIIIVKFVKIFIFLFFFFYPFFISNS